MSSNRFLACLFALVLAAWPACSTAATVIDQGTTGTSTVITTPAVVLNPAFAGSSGDLFIVAVGDPDDSAQPTSVASTIPGCTTFTLGGHFTDSPEASALYYCVTTGSYTTSSTVTATWLGTGNKMMVMASVAATTGHDVSGSNADLSNAPLFTSGTLAQPVELIFVGTFRKQPGITYTPNAAQIPIDFANNGFTSAFWEMDLSYIQTTSTTSTTYTSALSGPNIWYISFDGFKYTPASAGGGTFRTLTGAGR